MIDAATYAIERAMCDKARAYARATALRNGKQTNYLTAEEAQHPDYAACDNAMRGRVEQYELLTNTPERFGAYVSSDGKSIMTWTGDSLGSCHLGAGWRVRSFTGSRMFQATAWVNGREFTGRKFGPGMYVSLRETARSKRKRAV
jgi:hypothetical protein